MAEVALPWMDCWRRVAERHDGQITAAPGRGRMKIDFVVCEMMVDGAPLTLFSRVSTISRETIIRAPAPGARSLDLDLRGGVVARTNARSLAEAWLDESARAAVAQAGGYTFCLRKNLWEAAANGFEANEAHLDAAVQAVAALARRTVRLVIEWRRIAAEVNGRYALGRARDLFHGLSMIIDRRGASVVVEPWLGSLDRREQRLYTRFRCPRPRGAQPYAGWLPGEPPPTWMGVEARTSLAGAPVVAVLPEKGNVALFTDGLVDSSDIADSLASLAADFAGTGAGAAATGPYR